MRRPAVLAFSLFAIAASLPAEIRECLPTSAACGHRTAAAATSCPRTERQGHCASQRPVGCAKTRPPHDARNCRLHPTPPIVLHPPAGALAAPLACAPVVPPISFAAPVATPRGWRRAPALRPRASPSAAPRSPRPPPFTV